MHTTDVCAMPNKKPSIFQLLQCVYVKSIKEYMYIACTGLCMGYQTITFFWYVLHV